MTAYGCVAVAVSGGADSLYALAQLSREYRVIALHGLFWPPKPDNMGTPASEFSVEDALPHMPDLRQACDLLGVELHVVDLRAAFDAAVVLPFIEAYRQGHTPNPCAHCNAHIKFGALWEAAQALGADALATGHYAALELHPVYGTALRQGQDNSKDQSYFLSLVPKDRLQRALFPLARQHKAEAIAALQTLGLRVPLPKESQDICFVPQELQGGYRSFLRSQAAQRGLKLSGSGPMRLPDGTIAGRHQGLWHYTQGQRRGLGVAYAEALYVTGKDIKTNTLLIGTKDDCLMRQCHTRRANLLVPPALWPENLYVRVRYRQHNAPAKVEVQPDNSLHIHFHTPQQASTSGQVATLYDSQGFVLAGAVITAILP